MSDLIDTPRDRGNFEELARQSREIERLTAENSGLKAKIDNANMAASETARDWEARCYSIINALGEDYE